MPYQISREGQTYGPYTLEDLQRYVASGNVLLTDLAKSDDSPDWISVAQILNPAAGTAAAAGAATPAGPGSPVYVPPAAPYGQPASYAASPYPDPPNLHWGLVLLLNIVTCDLFALIWAFVQALWVKRVTPTTRALVILIGFAFVKFALSGSYISNASLRTNGVPPHTSPLSGLLILAWIVLLIWYRFEMRTALEQHFNGPEPLGLRLNPIMTFFFGGLYFQYHFNRINEMKQAMRYRGY